MFPHTLRSAMRAGLFAAALATGAAATSQAAEAGLDVQSGLSHRALEDAAVYARFVAETGSLNGKFKDGNDVRRALKASASWEQNQLQSGEIAYAALAALQEPEFVEGLRRAAREGGAGRIADQLLRDPAAVLDLPGAERAAARASSALAAQADRVMAAGKVVKQSAYDVQHQAWSKQAVTDRPQRLALIKTLSSTRSGDGPEASAHLSRAVLALSRGEADGGRAGAPSAVVLRGVSLAALAVLGRAGDDHAKEVQAVMTEPANDMCLKMAKLNLFQCLAVAGPKYEDIFCMGEHGLKETASCMTKAVSTPAAYTRRSVWPDDGRRAGYEDPYRQTAARDGEEQSEAPPPPEDRRERRRRDREPTREHYDPTRY